MKKIYRLENLDCANCAAKMERAVSKIDGVANVCVNFMMQKMTLECPDGDFDRIDGAARAACKKIEPDCNVR